MAERKVDKLAGPQSFADKLRKRRELLESGDPEAADNVFRDQLKVNKKKPKSPVAQR